MQAVQFKKPYDVYNSGEVAGFAPEKAAELVQFGVAEYYPKPEANEQTAEAEADTAGAIEAAAEEPEAKVLKAKGRK